MKAGGEPTDGGEPSDGGATDGCCIEIGPPVRSPTPSVKRNSDGGGGGGGGVNAALRPLPAPVAVAPDRSFSGGTGPSS